MKKADLINAICEMQPNIPRTLLSKKEFPKKNLEDLYKRLVNNQEYADLLDEDLARKKSRRKPKEKEKKKQVKIIEFSDSDVEEEVEKVEEKKQEPIQVEELPKVMPPMTRQRAEYVEEHVEEKKPKLNKIKIKKEIKNMLVGFIKEVKDLVLEYKANKDDDYLLDHYNLLLKDQEEIYQEYLESVDAPDDIYNYAADLLSVHTGKIERLVN